MTPTALDLFCGGGGAAEGYRRAGFRVIGIDLADHADSFGRVGEFHRMDWRDGLDKFIADADVIHASPPCQKYSQLTRWGRKGNVDRHPDLIGPVREALAASGRPYIIENVPRSPLIDPIMLCAWTFSYETYRHRLFESGGGLRLTAPKHRRHIRRAASPGHWQGQARDEGWFVSVGGHFAPARLCREVMDIAWMTGPELAESIPPYYTAYLASQIWQHLLLAGRQPGPEAAELIWSKGQTALPIYLGDGSLCVAAAMGSARHSVSPQPQVAGHAARQRRLSKCPRLHLFTQLLRRARHRGIHPRARAQFPPRTPHRCRTTRQSRVLGSAARRVDGARLGRLPGCR